jgi:hypothetical protein
MIECASGSKGCGWLASYSPADDKRHRCRVTGVVLDTYVVYVVGDQQFCG